MITEDLPKPIIKRDYDPDFEFEKWENTGYKESGRLERVWSVDTSKEELEFYNQDSLSIIEKIWSFPSTKKNRDGIFRKRFYINPKSGEVLKKYKPPFFFNDNRASLAVEFFDASGDYVLERPAYKDTVYSKNKRGQILWFHKFKNIYEDYMIKYWPIITCTYKDMAIIHYMGKLISIDISSGEVNWILKNNKKDYFVNAKQRDGYLWVSQTREGDLFMMVGDSECYRINLETLEVLKVISESGHFIGDIGFKDYKFYVSDQEFMYEYDISTGLETKRISLPEKQFQSHAYASFDYINPFVRIDVEMTLDNPDSASNLEKIIYTEDFLSDKFVYATKKHLFKDTKEYLNSIEYKIFRCVFEQLFYHKILIGYDDEKFFGADIESGQKTWWIDRSELSDDALIQIVDRNGVCISEGSVISCYRKP
ncbi:MAG: hypothetical protein R2883_06255 [Caldisericia bacterium]